LNSSNVYKLNILNPKHIINRFNNMYNKEYKTKIIKDKYLNAEENIRY
jgi:elongation factor P hydroxylase